MKPTIAFIERLRQGPLLADGAMGTMLHHAGEPLNACFDELNLSDPERVTKIHQAFVEAGSELIETNTFSANRFKLLEHGLAEQVTAINAEAVRLAREVALRADKPIYVGGSVGPTGARLAPYGRVQPEQAYEVFREQMAAQAKAGVDVFVLETFTDLDQMQQ